MSPGSVHSGIAGAEYIKFRTFGNTRPPARSDAGSRSGFRCRRHCPFTTHMLDEHLRAETIRLFDVVIVVALARVADLAELLVPQLPAPFTERLEGVLRLPRGCHTRFAR